MTVSAIRSTFHTTLEATPEHVVFGMDMILPIEYQADWDVITIWKQRHIDQSNAHESSKWIDTEYSKGDNVLFNRPGILPKLTIYRGKSPAMLSITTC